MGFFDKKYCDICGDKIGMLGNRKLEDGNLCKNCAGKLSIWFNERRHSTVADIKKQLDYREENKKKVAQFQITRQLGENWRVLIDDNHRWFTVTRARNLAEANPDILNFTDLTSCNLSIDERHTELKREDKDGNKVSYNPPRFRYSYDFDIVVTVKNEFFDEMKFQINPSSVEIISEGSGFMNHGMGSSSFGRPMGFDPSYNLEYQQYKRLADEICQTLNGLAYGMSAGQNGYGTQMAQGYGAGMMNNGQMNNGMMNNPQMGYGQPNNGMMNNSQMGYGQPNNGMMNNSQMGYSQPNNGMMNNSQMGYGQPNNGMMNNSQTGYGQPNNPQMNNNASFNNTAMNSGSWICPNCNSTNTGNFCDCCGTPRPR